jgi:hypothetical protein
LPALLAFLPSAGLEICQVIAALPTRAEPARRYHHQRRITIGRLMWAAPGGGAQLSRP